MRPEAEEELLEGAAVTVLLCCEVEDCESLSFLRAVDEEELSAVDDAWLLSLLRVAR